MLTIIDALKARAEQDPARTFCEFEGITVSFGELRARVQQCAAGLRERGIGRHDRVAVMLRNHIEHIVVVYGLAWLGAVHVPVSIHLKCAGLALQLDDVRPVAVIAEADFQQELLAARDEIDADVKLLWRRDHAARTRKCQDSLSAVLQSTAPPFDAIPRTLDCEVMISYTSGTTGAPKGAVLNERFLQLGARSAATLAEVNRTDTLFLWEPFYHIAGWVSIYMAINHGARIALVEQFSASRCWEQIRASGATKLHYLGGVLNILLAQPAQPDDHDNPFYMAGGADAPHGRWHEFEERFGVQLREGYGLSEAANFALLNLDGPPGAVGKPIPEFDAWVAAPDGRGPALPQQVGELILRPKQPGLTMVRFHGNEEKTAETLLCGIVRTGDLAYVDQQGHFYFAGRATDSLRRRGENVSAWEVERVVNQCPGVIESAVIPVPAEVGEDDIKLVVRAEDPQSIRPEIIHDWCKKRLAYYQVPRYIEIALDLPHGPTQRVQKRLLSRSVAGIFDAQAFAGQ
jgi:crotonobetaine/carnitine-CoA ligase